MLWYIALVWNPLDDTAFCRVKSAQVHLPRALPDATVLLEMPGLLVIGAPLPWRNAQSHRFRNGCGLLLGTLFRSANPAESPQDSPNPPLTAADEALMVETRGRSLVSSHWGSYVLFLRPPGSSAVHVFRSPMGSLPCFWTDRNGVSLLFSNPHGTW